MIDPTRGANEETLRRLTDESYERFRIQFFEAVKKKLEDFEMTWDDLADKLNWTRDKEKMQGDVIKKELGSDVFFTLEEMNQIASVFSCEPYVIFRPRFPWTKS